VTDAEGCALRFSGARVVYQQAEGPVEAVGPLELSIDRGEAVAIIGPSGCGKSTLLYAAAGLVGLSSGSVTVFGERVSGPRRDVALILQDHGLFPWKRVLANATLGLELRGVGKADAQETGERMLAGFGLEGLGRRWPAQLSGGQRQRVAIARSLALQPQVLLMDEPFSSLDALTREDLQNATLDMWRSAGLALVLVTHSIDEAAFLGRRIVVLTRRPGTVAAVVDNPGMGDSGYRATDEYYSKAREVRARLDESMREEQT
jgi:NitT/TauT family transport system ATP-binding protein